MGERTAKEKLKVILPCTMTGKRTDLTFVQNETKVILPCTMTGRRYRLDRKHT
jgi:hypothetical protein